MVSRRNIEMLVDHKTGWGGDLGGFQGGGG